MACPVNHPLFHALVFLVGILVVLSRYVRAASDIPAHGDFGFAAAAGVSSTRDLVGSDWAETVASLTGGVGAGLLLLVKRNGGKAATLKERRSAAARPGSSLSQEPAWKHDLQRHSAT